MLVFRCDDLVRENTRSYARMRRRELRGIRQKIKMVMKYAERSTQAFILAYYFYIRRKKLIALRQLYAFVKSNSLKISYNSLRYSLYYMSKKGLLERRGRGIYDLAEDLKKLDFASIIKLIDQKRAEAGKTSSRVIRSESNKKELKKYAVSVSDLRKRYNVTNIARHVEKHIRKCRVMEAFGELIILCSGMRPSDLVEDISVVNGEVWLIIYERKTRRIRYVRFLGSVLMRLLMQRSELINILIKEFLEKLFLAKQGRRLSLIHI
mgnify:CR=1 FL=1